MSSSESGPQDFKVVQNSASSFELTDVSTGESQTVNLSAFDFAYSSLVSMDVDGQDPMKFKFLNACSAGMTFTFQLKGNSVEAKVYQPNQYKYKHYMPVP